MDQIRNAALYSTDASSGQPIAAKSSMGNQSIGDQGRFEAPGAEPQVTQVMHQPLGPTNNADSSFNNRVTDTMTE